MPVLYPCAFLCKKFRKLLHKCLPLTQHFLHFHRTINTAEFIKLKHKVILSPDRSTSPPSTMLDDEDHLVESAVPTFDFERLRVVAALGRGAKGVVFLAVDEETGDVLALKIIWKDLIEKKRKGVKGNASDGSEYRRVWLEKEILSKLKHPLLPRLRGVLATEKVIGYAIDYCPGGDLHDLQKRQTEKMFSDDVIRFYAAELVLALEYLHSRRIVCRDLKPENVMIQENGHIMLVDFDLSTRLPPRKAQTSPAVKRPAPMNLKRYSLFPGCCNSGIIPDDSDYQYRGNSAGGTADLAEKSNSFVGTEEYVAPEIIEGKGHDFAVDWWSLGVVLYEMLYGRTPFMGSDRKETFYRILAKKPDLVGEATPLRDLIRKLLEKDPKQRITLEEIKRHDFFKGIDWEYVIEVLRPPYIPASREGELRTERMDVEGFVWGIFGEEKEENKGEDDKKNTNDVLFTVF